MEQMSTNSIELIYMNNVIRKSLGFVEYDEYDHMLREKFWISIFKLLPISAWHHQTDLEFSPLIQSLYLRCCGISNKR